MGRKKLEKPSHCSVCGCEGVYMRSMCRKCYNRDLRERDPERARNRQRKYVARNKERVRELMRQWKSRNKDRVRKSNKASSERCKDKRRASQKVWLEANRDKRNEWRRGYMIARGKERNRWASIKSLYKISQADYESMLDAQGGGCAICGNPPPDGGNLNIDHNHDTGEVRGLLCRTCNLGIGHLKDSEVLVANALDYLMACGKREEYHKRRKA